MGIGGIFLDELEGTPRFTCFTCAGLFSIYQLVRSWGFINMV